MGKSYYRTVSYDHATHKITIDDDPDILVDYGKRNKIKFKAKDQIGWCFQGFGVKGNDGSLSFKVKPDKITVTDHNRNTTAKNKPYKYSLGVYDETDKKTYEEDPQIINKPRG